ncbi:MAG: chemotaxis protein CheW [Spirochaetaceae bacterium]|nr:chemotaxis protein CheW [Spirochaetaceae bacterium]
MGAWENSMTPNADANTLYFTFGLGAESYGLNVQYIREVLNKEKITPVPRTESYMKGIMNVRGAVIPVIDFRTLFHIETNLQNTEYSIVVTEYIKDDQPPLIFGFIADRVEGVNTLDSDSVSVQNSKELSAMNSNFIKKIGKIADQFILLLDIEQIIGFIEEDLEQKTKTV